ncbi:MAG TPA: DUF1003 domain-containing protein [Candidatus Limnocylindria bacterium]|jgi:uncharacterized membrane protein|nr:DUF1003 domain-containing protein [Candidatus Limnocylindria bacterium]
MSVTTSETTANDLKLSLRGRRSKGAAHKHPVNQLHHDDATFGEKLADRISAAIGSWPFLIIQSIFVVVWLVGNAILFFHFDPRPFILLNLLFSVQAAYTGPVLLLAGNRQAQKDRLTLEHACAEADKADLQNVQILKAIEKNTEVMLTILRHVETLVSDHIATKKA